MFDSIEDWIKSYIKIESRVEEFLEKIKEIPVKAKAIADGAKDEYTTDDLSAMEAITVTRKTISSVSKIKNVVEALMI